MSFVGVVERIIKQSVPSLQMSKNESTPKKINLHFVNNKGQVGSDPMKSEGNKGSDPLKTPA